MFLKINVKFNYKYFYNLFQKRKKIIKKLN